MSSKGKSWFMILILIFSTSCVNTARKLPAPKSGMKMGAGIGAGAGAVIGAVSGNVLAGAVLGGAAGTVIGAFTTGYKELINELMKEDIQYVEHGDRKLLIIPTDKYFEFNSSRFNSACYIGLMNVYRLLQFYPKNKFYIAGFTDDIGSKSHKNKLSTARAHAVETFLWSYGLSAQSLSAKGYSDKFDIGDNKFIHSSAYNRRIEIYWDVSKPLCDD